MAKFVPNRMYDRLIRRADRGQRYTIRHADFEPNRARSSPVPASIVDLTAERTKRRPDYDWK